MSSRPNPLMAFCQISRELGALEEFEGVVFETQQPEVVGELGHIVFDIRRRWGKNWFTVIVQDGGDLSVFDVKDNETRFDWGNRAEFYSLLMGEDDE